MIVQIPSEKNPDLLYTVDTEAKTCDCPHFTLSLAPKMANTPLPRLFCKHLKRALEGVSER
jgi:hypothetical protein